MQQDEAPPGIQFLNKSGIMNTIGFTIYNFEGIGVVMPVLATCQNPHDFKRMLTYTFLTLVIFYVIYSEICVMAWGSNLHPYVTENLPSDNIGVILVKFFYSLNLVCSYPIVIYPTNITIETLFYPRPSRPGHVSHRRYWAQNFTRFLVTATSVLLAAALASKIDKFVGLIGSVLCAPIAMTVPTILSMKTQK